NNARINQIVYIESWRANYCVGTVNRHRPAILGASLLPTGHLQCLVQCSNNWIDHNWVARSLIIYHQRNLSPACTRLHSRQKWFPVSIDGTQPGVTGYTLTRLINQLNLLLLVTDASPQISGQRQLQ